MYMYSGGKDIYIILYLWFDYNATKSNQMTKIKTTNIIDLGPAFFWPPPAFFWPPPPAFFWHPPRSILTPCRFKVFLLYGHFFLTSPLLFFDLPPWSSLCSFLTSPPLHFDLSPALFWPPHYFILTPPLLHFDPPCSCLTSPPAPFFCSFFRCVLFFVAFLLWCCPLCLLRVPAVGWPSCKPSGRPTVGMHSVVPLWWPLCLLSAPAASWPSR